MERGEGGKDGRDSTRSLGGRGSQKRSITCMASSYSRCFQEGDHTVVQHPGGKQESTLKL